MSKHATVTIVVNKTPLDFVVKTQSSAKRIVRLVNAMSLPNVGDTRISVHETELSEVSDVLKEVFAKAMGEDS